MEIVISQCSRASSSPQSRASVSVADLGSCDVLPEGQLSTAGFPLWSEKATNYWVRLALYTPHTKTYYYSAKDAVKEVSVTAVQDNLLLFYASANAAKGAYGDEPPAFGYEVSYGGATNGVGWVNKPEVTGAPGCEATDESEPGIYAVAQGTVALSNAEPYWATETDPETGEETQVPYYYQLVFIGADYIITNAVFSAVVGDASAAYTGDPFDVSEIAHEETGVRNGQEVSYLYRLGTGVWVSAFDASLTDVGRQIVQFKASAANHEDVFGTFAVSVTPAPLSATIEVAGELAYTGAAQTPEVVTNVTGLVRGDLNALTCSFRDEAGEWQGEVPSFTNPGRYTLYFRAEAPNHETAVASCTVTVEGWDYRVNLDGQTDYPTEILDRITFGGK